jgi:peptidyl-prolyl cis-trans isomerase SurA
MSIFIKPSERQTSDQVQLRLAHWFENISEQSEPTVRNQLFSQLALQHSEEKYSASKGGDIGWISRSHVVPKFYQMLQGLKPGELSQPFKTTLGWHLVLLVAKREATETQEPIRQRAQQILFNQKFEAKRQAWISRLREDAKIEIFL